MQQLSIFDSPQTGFKYRRRLYNDKDQYLYTAIPTENGFSLNRVQSLAENIGLLQVSHKEYEIFKSEHGLTELLPKDVKERLSV